MVNHLNFRGRFNYAVTHIIYRCIVHLRVIQKVQYKLLYSTTDKDSFVAHTLLHCVCVVFTDSGYIFFIMTFVYFIFELNYGRSSE